MDKQDYLGKEFSVGICSDKEISKGLLEKCFPNGKIEVENLGAVVEEIQMTYGEFVDAVFSVVNGNRENNWDFVLENSNNYFSESFVYESGNNFVERKFIPDDFPIASGKDALIARIFHEQSEKVILK